MDKGSRISAQEIPMLASGYAAPVIAGLAVGIAFIFAVSMTLNSAASLQPTEDDNNSFTSYVSKPPNWCHESIEYAKSKASFHVFVPTSLPDGYSLQNVDVIPDNMVFLFYFTRSMCDPNDVARPEEGLIEIVEGPLDSVSSAKSGSEYVEKQQSEYEKGGTVAKTFLLKNGTMHAIGYESGVSESVAIDENGKIVHTSEYFRPAALWVVDDGAGTLCKIQARSDLHSLDDLAKIAESLS